MTSEWSKVHPQLVVQEASRVPGELKSPAAPQSRDSSWPGADTRISMSPGPDPHEATKFKKNKAGRISRPGLSVSAT